MLNEFTNLQQSIELRKNKIVIEDVNAYWHGGNLYYHINKRMINAHHGIFAKFDELLDRPQFKNLLKSPEFIPAFSVLDLISWIQKHGYKIEIFPDSFIHVHQDNNYETTTSKKNFLYTNLIQNLCNSVLWIKEQEGK